MADVSAIRRSIPLPENMNFKIYHLCVLCAMDVVLATASQSQCHETGLGNWLTNAHQYHTLGDIWWHTNFNFFISKNYIHFIMNYILHRNPSSALPNPLLPFHVNQTCWRNGHHCGQLDQLQVECLYIIVLIKLLKACILQIQETE